MRSAVEMDKYNTIQYSTIQHYVDRVERRQPTADRVRKHGRPNNNADEKSLTLEDGEQGLFITCSDERNAQ